MGVWGCDTLSERDAAAGTECSWSKLLLQLTLCSWHGTGPPNLLGHTNAHAEPCLRLSKQTAVELLNLHVVRKGLPNLLICVPCPALAW